MRYGLVLSGGGARGAYEVGLLLYLAELLKDEPFPFQILTGTSVGAIHAAFLAGVASGNWQQGAQRLAQIWHQFQFREMVQIREGIFRFFFSREKRGLFGFLDVEGFRTVVVRGIPWLNIDDAMRSGTIFALAVSATEIASGKTVVFYDCADPKVELKWQNDPRITGVRTRIGPKHVLASASIPLLFPPTPIQKKLYSDGSLRMNIPLSPALRLGADKVFVVCMRPQPEREATPDVQREVAYSSPLYLIARTLDVLFADPLERDLQQLRMMNDLVVNADTPEEKQRVQEWAMRFRGAPFRYVEPFVICPSRNLNELVLEAFRESKTLPFWFRRWLFTGETSGKLDLLSFLLFDGSYARLLMELGYQDLKARRNELEQFLFGEASHHRSRRDAG